MIKITPGSGAPNLVYVEPELELLHHGLLDYSIIAPGMCDERNRPKNSRSGPQRVIINDG